MRGIIIGGSGITVLGLVISGLSLLWNFVTRNDGDGADFGAAILWLLGIVVVVIGIVMALIGVGVAVVRRLRA